MFTLAKKLTRPPTPGLVLLSFAAHAAADPAVSQNADGESSWFRNVDKTQEEQPHWITPLVTITPRLEEEYRYDQTRQYKSGSTTLTNYGGGKGLELIPSENVETIIGQPGHLVQQNPKTTTRGWADETFLVKYRFLSENEEHGNYIVTGFLGLSTPTGNNPFTSNHTIVTPTIAAGKGWGSRERGVDVQSTLSAAIPDASQNVVGLPIVWSTALQAHFSQILWPEIEANYTHWKDGPFAGKNQLIMTYGVILGRIPLEGRTKLILGVGYQASSMTSFSTYNRGWVTSARVAF